jgi:hypothetical protein
MAASEIQHFLTTQNRHQLPAFRPSDHPQHLIPRASNTNVPLSCLIAGWMMHGHDLPSLFLRNPSFIIGLKFQAF